MEIAGGKFFKNWGKGDAGRQAGRETKGKKGKKTYAFLGLFDAGVSLLTRAISRDIVFIKDVEMGFTDDLKGTFRV